MSYPFKKKYMNFNQNKLNDYLQPNSYLIKNHLRSYLIKYHFDDLRVKIKLFFVSCDLHKFYLNILISKETNLINEHSNLKLMISFFLFF